MLIISWVVLVFFVMFISYILGSSLSDSTDVGKRIVKGFGLLSGACVLSAIVSICIHYLTNYYT